MLFFENNKMTDNEKMDVTEDVCNFLMTYEEKCLSHFIKICDHVDCRLHYQISFGEINVYYYYNHAELFNVNKDINILRQFFKKCKFNKNNRNLTDIQTPILYSKKDDNYSNILFNRNFTNFTRLDVKKR